MKLDQKAFTLIELMIVIVILGILSSIAISVTMSFREKASIRMLESDLSTAYKAAVVFHTDNPNGEVTLDTLAAQGFNKSEGVTIEVVNGKVDTLEIDASHPNVLGIYQVDKTGKISKK
jgi:type IV pilus assembly protein PilA